MSTLTPFASYSLAEIAKRTDPNGDAHIIAEVLMQDNEILQDAVWLEANGITTHKSLKRVSLPSGQWRKFNEGVSPENSQTQEIVDNIGMLETVCEMDEALATLHPGGVNAARQQESTAFIEGLGQTLASTMFYGNTGTDPEKFLGLHPRYNLTSKSNVIGASGTGSDTASVWIVQWGPTTAHMVYPRGSKAGISRADMGIVSLTDTNGKKYRGYQEFYRMQCGLVVRDDRCIQRIANIETSGSSNIIDEDYIIRALNRMPKRGAGARIYMNTTLATQLDIIAKDKTNVNYTSAEIFGRPVTLFRGVPIRICDQLVNTETAIS